MKVLMVTYSFPPRYAGVSIQAVYLSKELMRQGIDLDIVTNNFTDKTVIEEYEGIKVYKFCSYFEYKVYKLWILRNFIYMSKVLILALRSNYQIVFFHGFGGYDTWILPILVLFKKKTITELTLVGSDDPLTIKNQKLGFIFIPLLRLIDKIIPISTRLKELSIEAGINKEKLELIPVGVDLQKFVRLKPNQREILRNDLGYSNKKYVFLAVGQVESRKGYDFMIRAWKHINKELSNAVLLIAGPQNDSSNKYYQDLLQYIQREKIENILFLGMIKNINEYMRISDCLLHCATKEGLPNTLLEASIASVPIVCRKMEGITSDIILNRNIGRECITDDPKDFAELVFALLRERNLDQIDSDFKKLKEKFAIERVAEKYINLFNSLTTYV